MNFHRGFNEWHWIRGQECDRFHEGRARAIPDWKQHVTPKMNLDARKVTELKMYLRNVAFRQSEEDYFSPQVFRRATRWIEENYDAEKFFLYIDSFDPHEPWDPPQYYRDMYDPGYDGIEVLNPDYVDDYTTYLTDDELKHMRALYAGEVTMVDTWLGHFLRKVYQLGLHENTMIIIMSDHGHQLGENGYVGKHNTGLYPCLMDLFLAIQHPDGIGKGSTMESLVYNHDLYPTMLESLGLDIPEWAEGKSLIPLMAGKQDKLRDYVTSMFKNYPWIRDAEYTFFCRSDKTDFRLYDNEKDPAQTTNVAADHPDICEKMWNRILKDGGGEIPFWELGPISKNIPP
jgi:arylsulfatase A-like enzyme